MREAFFMDFRTIVDLISKSNINNEQIYSLVKEASSLDLNNEDNLRTIIRKSCGLANKSISEEQENKIIKLLKDKGITPELFSLLNK